MFIHKKRVFIAGAILCLGVGAAAAVEHKAAPQVWAPPAEIANKPAAPAAANPAEPGAPAAATPAAPAAVKSCDTQADAKSLRGRARRDFVKSCESPVAAAKPSRGEDCSTQADAKGLQGRARDAFRDGCMAAR